MVELLLVCSIVVGLWLFGCRFVRVSVVLKERFLCGWNALCGDFFFFFFF